jgi:hypothetical protein
VARLPLSAETGDISRVERFRWIVLEAAAGEAMYRPVLWKKPGIYGGLMDFPVPTLFCPVLKRKYFVKQGLQASRGASSNNHKLPDVTVSGVAGAPYLRLISWVSGAITAGS